MERLTSLVGREDDQWQPRMPRRIDASGKDGVVTHIYLTDLSIIDHYSATMILTCMKEHSPRILLLIIMAVDTLSVLLRTTKHIIDHHPFVIVLQASLIESQLLISDIRRRDESVAEVRVDAIC